ncbi:hypothetical protein Mgra_00006454 [Meloidogyne graminicola]|uniref:Uncharacterized protein n=1 Tax=Meloidogyne graminicola TaxID=189291 RepID=A0A8S9ZM29_9BILA|nr:hypothetical protein Mgra_00006454 [Meloidogyne graminicola]
MFYSSKLIIPLFIFTLLIILSNFANAAVTEIIVENSPYETWLEDEVEFFRDDDNSGNNSTKAVSKCLIHAKCYSDSDCGLKGRCVGGTKVAKCDCTPCRTGLICKPEDPKACGGLQHACNEKIKICQCEQAWKKAGYPTIYKARTEFCGHKACSWNNDSCFGLPCKSGNCRCRH